MRALAARGDRLVAAEAMPIPESIGALLRHRVEALSGAANDVLLLAAASPQPTASRLAAIAGSADGLDEAFGAGILAPDGQRVRFTHPLLASVVVRLGVAAEAPRRARPPRGGGLRPYVERARHLALATGRA